jgi:hypothetical protein
VLICVSRRLLKQLRVRRRYLRGTFLDLRVNDTSCQIDGAIGLAMLWVAISETDGATPSVAPSRLGTRATIGLPSQRLVDRVTWLIPE